MLADIQPNLKNIADWHAVFPDNSTKSTLAVPRNAHVEVCFFFLCIPRKAEVLQNCGVQALQIKIWLHPVHKSDAQCFGGCEQPEAQTRSRRRSP